MVGMFPREDKILISIPSPVKHRHRSSLWLAAESSWINWLRFKLSHSQSSYFRQQSWRSTKWLETKSPQATKLRCSQQSHSTWRSWCFSLAAYRRGAPGGMADVWILPAARRPVPGSVGIPGTWSWGHSHLPATPGQQVHKVILSTCI